MGGGIRPTLGGSGWGKTKKKSEFINLVIDIYLKNQTARMLRIFQNSIWISIIKRLPLKFRLKWVGLQKDLLLNCIRKQNLHII